MLLESLRDHKTYSYFSLSTPGDQTWYARPLSIGCALAAHYFGTSSAFEGNLYSTPTSDADFCLTTWMKAYPMPA
jgi:hypothetical protein